MAYKQSSGRGNRAKTGHGVPSAFMQQKPNYQAANIAEAENQYGVGASYAASKALSDYPAQKKHVIKNAYKDEKTGSSSYEIKRDARKAVEQIQVARDSMAYLGNTKDPKEREGLGASFSFNYSPNSKYGKKQINERHGGEYQGPGRESGSQEDKKKILQNLRFEGATLSTTPDMAQKTFGIGAVPKAEEKNKISGAKKKSPVKQEVLDIPDNETLKKAFTSMNRTDFSGSGVTGNAKTGEFSANPFETIYVKSQNPYQLDYTISKDPKKGTDIQKATRSTVDTNQSLAHYWNKNIAKSEKQLYSGFKKDSTMTMNNRNAEANKLRLQFKQTQDYMKYAGAVTEAIKHSDANKKTKEKKR